MDKEEVEAVSNFKKVPIFLYSISTPRPTGSLSSSTKAGICTRTAIRSTSHHFSGPDISAIPSASGRPIDRSLAR